jgi:hypothetical protein|uniref:Uncharacterized protein n=1 Tax=viral metagenome TaxID=1070528 RepID=A0A6C0BQF9_9ZZZZ
MKTIIFIFLFLGMLMIVHGIYEEKIEKIKKDVRVKYKFIPRTYYDEFLMNDKHTSQSSKAMFDNVPDTRSAGFPVR